MRGRQRDRHKQGQTETGTDRWTETGTDRQTETGTDRQTDINRDRQTQGQTEGQKQGQTDRNRDRQTDTGTQRYTDRNKDRQTSRNRDRQKQGQRETWVVRGSVLVSPQACLGEDVGRRLREGRHLSLQPPTSRPRRVQVPWELRVDLPSQEGKRRQEPHLRPAQTASSAEKGP